MSTVLVENGAYQDASKLVQTWRDRIEWARGDRQQYEPTWASNIAFTAGKHWLSWNTATSTLELPLDLQGRELYTADVITERRMTALGELAGDDDRPELLLVDDGDEATEAIQEQINKAMAYGWDFEWRGDDALTEARRLCLDLGTSAIRARFDRSAGPPMKGDDGNIIQAPVSDGAPIVDPEQARSFMADAAARGERPELRPLFEGRIRWEPLSAFNLLVPPGVPHEADFPWEIVVRPVELSKVKAEFPTAATLGEDTDISSMLGIDSVQNQSADVYSEKRSKLRGHVWVYTCYERPCADYPKGRVVTLAGSQMQLLHVQDELPVIHPDGTHGSGISYFHWWRVTGRFWSRAFVEPLKDPQRIINRRKTQNAEIVDRGMPKVFVEEGSLIHNPRGLPLEKVEVTKGAAKPDFFGGMGPGEWMYRDIEEARIDLDHASGVRGPSIGENPENVGTYSQLALLSEKDQVKRAPVRKEHQSAIGKLVEASAHLIRTYWSDGKQIVLAGDDDDRVEAFTFNASKVPTFFVVRIAKGSPKPRSQAAEIKKIEDIARYSIESQQPLPVEWLVESFETGKPADLPGDPAQAHLEKARLENHYLLTGEPSPAGDVFAAEYDPPELHIPIHREAQIEAEQIGDAEAWSRIQLHIDEHEQAALAMAAQQAEIAGPQTNDADVQAEAQAQPAQEGR